MIPALREHTISRAQSKTLLTDSNQKAELQQKENFLACITYIIRYYMSHLVPSDKHLQGKRVSYQKEWPWGLDTQDLSLLFA